MNLQFCAQICHETRSTGKGLCLLHVVSAGVTQLGTKGSTCRWFSHMAGKWVLAVSWEFRDGWGPGAWASLHVGLSTGCSGSPQHSGWLLRASLTGGPGEEAVSWEMFNTWLLGGNALICNVCCFPWCQYAHHGQFQGTEHRVGKRRAVSSQELVSAGSSTRGWKLPWP